MKNTVKSVNNNGASIYRSPDTRHAKRENYAEQRLVHLLKETLDELGRH